MAGHARPTRDEKRDSDKECGPSLAPTVLRAVPSHDAERVRVAPGGMARPPEWNASTPRAREPAPLHPLAPAMQALSGTVRQARLLPPQAVWVHAVGQEPEDVRALLRWPGWSCSDVPTVGRRRGRPRRR